MDMAEGPADLSKIQEDEKQQLQEREKFGSCEGEDVHSLTFKEMSELESERESSVITSDVDSEKLSVGDVDVSRAGTDDLSGASSTSVCDRKKRNRRRRKKRGSDYQTDSQATTPREDNRIEMDPEQTAAFCAELKKQNPESEGYEIKHSDATSQVDVAESETANSDLSPRSEFDTHEGPNSELELQSGGEKVELAISELSPSFAAEYKDYDVSDPKFKARVEGSEADEVEESKFEQKLEIELCDWTPASKQDKSAKDSNVIAQLQDDKVKSTNLGLTPRSEFDTREGPCSELELQSGGVEAELAISELSTPLPAKDEACDVSDSKLSPGVEGSAVDEVSSDEVAQLQDDEVEIINLESTPRSEIDTREDPNSESELRSGGEEAELVISELSPAFPAKDEDDDVSDSKLSPGLEGSEIHDISSDVVVELRDDEFEVNNLGSTPRSELDTREGQNFESELQSRGEEAELVVSELSPPFAVEDNETSESKLTAGVDGSAVDDVSSDLVGQLQDDDVDVINLESTPRSEIDTQAGPRSELEQQSGGEEAEFAISELSSQFVAEDDDVSGSKSTAVVEGSEIDEVSSDLVPQIQDDEVEITSLESTPRAEFDAREGQISELELQSRVEEAELAISKLSPSFAAEDDEVAESKLTAGVEISEIDEIEVCELAQNLENKEAEVAEIDCCEWTSGSRQYKSYKEDSELDAQSQDYEVESTNLGSTPRSEFDTREGPDSELELQTGVEVGELAISELSPPLAAEDDEATELKMTAGVKGTTVDEDSSELVAQLQDDEVEIINLESTPRSEIDTLEDPNSESELRSRGEEAELVISKSSPSFPHKDEANDVSDSKSTRDEEGSEIGEVNSYLVAQLLGDETEIINLESTPRSEFDARECLHPELELQSAEDEETEIGISESSPPFAPENDEVSELKLTSGVEISEIDEIEESELAQKLEDKEASVAEIDCCECTSDFKQDKSEKEEFNLVAPLGVDEAGITNLESTPRAEFDIHEGPNSESELQSQDEEAELGISDLSPPLAAEKEDVSESKLTAVVEVSEVDEVSSDLVAQLQDDEVENWGSTPRSEFGKREGPNSELELHSGDKEDELAISEVSPPFAADDDEVSESKLTAGIEESEFAEVDYCELATKLEDEKAEAAEIDCCEWISGSKQDISDKDSSDLVAQLRDDKDEITNMESTTRSEFETREGPHSELELQSEDEEAELGISELSPPLAAEYDDDDVSDSELTPGVEGSEIGEVAECELEQKLEDEKAEDVEIDCCEWTRGSKQDKSDKEDSHLVAQLQDDEVEIINLGSTPRSAFDTRDGPASELELQAEDEAELGISELSPPFAPEYEDDDVSDSEWTPEVEGSEIDYVSSDLVVQVQDDEFKIKNLESTPPKSINSEFDCRGGPHSLSELQPGGEESELAISEPSPPFTAKDDDVSDSKSTPDLEGSEVNEVNSHLIAQLQDDAVEITNLGSTPLSEFNPHEGPHPELEIGSGRQEAELAVSELSPPFAVEDDEVSETKLTAEVESSEIHEIEESALAQKLEGEEAEVAEGSQQGKSDKETSDLVAQLQDDEVEITNLGLNLRAEFETRECPDSELELRSGGVETEIAISELSPPFPAKDEDDDASGSNKLTPGVGGSEIDEVEECELALKSEDEEAEVTEIDCCEWTSAFKQVKSDNESSDFLAQVQHYEVEISKLESTLRSEFDMHEGQISELELQSGDEGAEVVEIDCCELTPGYKQDKSDTESSDLVAQVQDDEVEIINLGSTPRSAFETREGPTSELELELRSGGGEAELAISELSPPFAAEDDEVSESKLTTGAEELEFVEAEYCGLATKLEDAKAEAAEIDSCELTPPSPVKSVVTKLPKVKDPLLVSRKEYQPRTRQPKPLKAEYTTTQINPNGASNMSDVDLSSAFGSRDSFEDDHNQNNPFGFLCCMRKRSKSAKKSKSDGSGRPGERGRSPSITSRIATVARKTFSKQ